MSKKTQYVPIRVTEKQYRALLSLAKKEGFRKPDGKPNVSEALRHLIDLRIRDTEGAYADKGAEVVQKRVPQKPKVEEDTQDSQVY